MSVIELKHHSDGIGYASAQEVMNSLSDTVRESDPQLADYLRSVADRVQPERILKFSLDGVESKSPYGTKMPSGLPEAGANLLNELSLLVAKGSKILDAELASAEAEKAAAEARIPPERRG